MGNEVQTRILATEVFPSGKECTWQGLESSVSMKYPSAKRPNSWNRLQREIEKGKRERQAGTRMKNEGTAVHSLSLEFY